jgi:pimeloyl-ACP methyl ester carboxylesterase
MRAKFSRVVGRYVYVTVKGVEYRVYFEEAGQGIPVLCQHTAGSDGRQWRYFLESSELASRFRFVAYDLPYHGKSLPPISEPWWRERYSLSQSFLVQFVEAMVGALDMEKPIYVGCSMGGHLAPDLALQRPGLFRAVVAVEGGLATHDPEPFNKYLSHPRASNEAKAALMMGQTSPRSPEPHRRETVWVYSQGGSAGLPRRPRLLPRRARLDEDGVRDRHVQDAGPRNRRRLRLVGDARALQGSGRRHPGRDLYPDGWHGAFSDVRKSRDV